MSQKQFKRERQAAKKHSQKLIDENLTIIRDELLKDMVDRSFWKRLKVAVLIIFSMVK